ncbi:unnamed protein product [Calicophoron daubneyi]|uniref:Uncharacterized protein n=1 Tax=Calicophoron daubneyi TaxID=300641 RepID=A0AAV2TYF7_CALDB
MLLTDRTTDRFGVPFPVSNEKYELKELRKSLDSEGAEAHSLDESRAGGMGKMQKRQRRGTCVNRASDSRATPGSDDLLWKCGSVVADLVRNQTNRSDSGQKPGSHVQ